MNKIILGKLQHALENMEFKVCVPEETRKKAAIALDRMLAIF
ncbi:MAG: quinolinate synthase NadA [Bacteroidales bacterium]|nr:quinolinate synthase NadA [Bacteroidales bacterium]